MLVKTITDTFPLKIHSVGRFDGIGYMFNIRPSGHLDQLSMLLLKIRRKYVGG